MFWKLLGSYGVVLGGAIALLGFGLAAQLQRHELATIQAGLRGDATLIRRRVQDQASAWIAAGHYGRRIHLDGRAEIAALAAAFNRMAQEVAGRSAAMESDRQQLRAVLSGMA